MTHPASRPSQRRRPAADPESERRERVEWIEKQGLDSIRARFATADLIAKEAQTTLTVLLAGVGGTAAYAAKLLEPGQAEPLTIAAAATCGYLAALGAILVFACMRLQSYPAQYQEPMNLLVNHPLLKIREWELENLDERIKEATQLNNRRARHLNQIRLMAVFSIVVFVAVGAVAPRKAAGAAPRLTIQCAPNEAASAPRGALTCQLSS